MNLSASSLERTWFDTLEVFSHSFFSSLNLFTNYCLSVPPEIIHWSFFNTFGNYFGIENYFTKYSEESCWYYLFIYFPSYLFVCKVSFKLLGCFWPL